MRNIQGSSPEGRLYRALEKRGVRLAIALVERMVRLDLSTFDRGRMRVLADLPVGSDLWSVQAPDGLGETHVVGWFRWRSSALATLAYYADTSGIFPTRLEICGDAISVYEGERVSLTMRQQRFEDVDRSESAKWTRKLAAISDAHMHVLVWRLRRETGYRNISFWEEYESLQNRRDKTRNPMFKTPWNYARTLRGRIKQITGVDLGPEDARNAFAEYFGFEDWQWLIWQYEECPAPFPCVILRPGQPVRWFRSWEDGLTAVWTTMREHNMASKPYHVEVSQFANDMEPFLEVFLLPPDSPGCPSNLTARDNARWLYFGAAPGRTDDSCRDGFSDYRVGFSGYYRWAANLEARNEWMQLGAELAKFFGMNNPWQQRLARIDHRLGKADRSFVVGDYRVTMSEIRNCCDGTDSQRELRVARFNASGRAEHTSGTGCAPSETFGIAMFDPDQTSLIKDEAGSWWLQDEVGRKVCLVGISDYQAECLGLLVAGNCVSLLYYPGEASAGPWYEIPTESRDVMKPAVQLTSIH